MIAVLSIPPPPQPVIVRPNRNMTRLLAAAVINSPIDMKRLEKERNSRGVNINERRPARGVALDIPI